MSPHSPFLNCSLTRKLVQDFPTLRFSWAHLGAYLSSPEPEPSLQDRWNHRLLLSSSFSLGLATWIWSAWQVAYLASSILIPFYLGNKIYAPISLEFFSFSLKLSKTFSFPKFLTLVMVTIMCQLDWAMKCPDTSSNIIQGLTMRIFWLRLTFESID